MHRYKQPLVLEDIPIPDIGPTQVPISREYTLFGSFSGNFTDLTQVGFEDVVISSAMR